MKRKKILHLKGLITLAMCVSAFVVSAQNLTVRGTVTDKNNEPVIGATVVVEGDLTRGTVTDVDGNYVLPNVPENAKLVFSYVGMKKQIVSVNGRTVINVVMEEEAELLEEVVVTALGVPKQARSVGYATAKVSPTEIERTNAVNVVNALQGKVAGVNINIGGASGVTSSSAITIRGAKSIDKNNSPIFVIDGMIIQEYCWCVNM